jgi:serine/threonine protein kinase
MLAESCCHTNITELLDVFNGDVPRLVYSWPANSMLLHHAVALGRTRSFAHSQKAAVMADVLKGLAFLHSRGVVHQGLAPVAVGLLFSAQKAPRQAQILDLAGSAVIGCVNEAASGLPEYRAPEIHLGTTDLHPSQDIWAIGAIMALLATGVQLFETGLSYREEGHAEYHQDARQPIRLGLCIDDLSAPLVRGFCCRHCTYAMESSYG